MIEVRSTRQVREYPVDNAAAAFGFARREANRTGKDTALWINGAFACWITKTGVCKTLKEQ